MNVYFVYLDWTLEEHPRVFYVGKGVLDRVHRRERNVYWKNIAAKYGWRREVVLGTKDESFAFEEEKQRIAELGTFEDGTPGRWGANLTEGGEGPSGAKLTPERRAAISEFMRQRPRQPLSEESKARISEALKGKPSYRKGKKFGPLSPEHREKIANHHRGKKRAPYKKQKPRSESHRENIGASLRGKPKSPEHRQKLREAALRRWELKSKRNNEGRYLGRWYWFATSPINKGRKQEHVAHGASDHHRARPRRPP